MRLRGMRRVIDGRLADRVKRVPLTVAFHSGDGWVESRRADVGADAASVSAPAVMARAVDAVAPPCPVTSSVSGREQFSNVARPEAEVVLGAGPSGVSSTIPKIPVSRQTMT